MGIACTVKPRKWRPRKWRTSLNDDLYLVLFSCKWRPKNSLDDDFSEIRVYDKCISKYTVKYYKQYKEIGYGWQSKWNTFGRLRECRT